MVYYIIQLLEDIKKIQANHLNEARHLFGALLDELERLDPRDFLPKYQNQFVKTRALAKHFKSISRFHPEDYDKVQGFCSEFISCLDNYGGEGSRAVTRSFDFISDVELRNIIVRDYKEFTLNLFPSGAWKSCVVMAGSILEAILQDILTKDKKILIKAKSSPDAPRYKNGSVKDIEKGKWKLHDLIKVGVDLKILPEDRAKSIDQILRDYRNFIHPSKEKRAGHPCAEAEAYLAKGALDSVCNHLELLNAT